MEAVLCIAELWLFFCQEYEVKHLNPTWNSANHEEVFDKDIQD